MTVSMQVAYPITDDTKFDHDYYVESHLAIIKENWSDHIQQMIVTKEFQAEKTFHHLIMLLRRLFLKITMR